MFLQHPLIIFSDLDEALLPGVIPSSWVSLFYTSIKHNIHQ